MRFDVFIRKVEKTDMEAIYELSNKDYVRKHSLNKKKISWKEHVKWFGDVLKNKDIVFHVVTDSNNRFLGQIRYNIKNDTAIISISFGDLIIGKGLGKVLLSSSMTNFFIEKSNVVKIIAYISTENISSVKLFEKTNFELFSRSEELLEYLYIKENNDEN